MGTETKMFNVWNSYIVKNSIGIHPKSLNNWHNAFRSAENFIKKAMEMIGT
jgi:hypothetical protein